MEVTKTITDKTTVLLRIQLLPEELQPYLQRAAKRVSEKVTIPGFRPGNAPYDILKQHVSEMDIYQEAVDDVLKNTLPTAVKQENVDFVGQPQVAIETLAPNNPLVYTATFALMPDVQLPDYSTLAVKKKEITLDEGKVQSTLERLRKLRGRTQTAEKAADKGDQVVVDFTISLAGVVVEGGQGKDVPIVIGEDIFVPGFEEQLLGLKANDNKNFSITFPQEYAAKHLAGKQCDVAVTVKSVSIVTMPALDEALAKELNFSSLVELTESVRANIKRELEAKAEQEFEAKVMEEALRQATFDPISPLMLEVELDRMVEELHEQVENRGGKMDDYLQHIKKTKEELRGSWKENAVKRIKSALVIKAVAEKENVTVTEEEMTAEINRRKEALKEDAETQKQLDSFEYRGYLRTILRNQKAVEKLKGYAIQPTPKE